MKIGKYYSSNQKRLALLEDADWQVALAKCKEHIEWRLKAKTLSGAHAAANLGADPIDHYLGLSYEKLLNGDWQWKEKFELSEQMIRIVDSHISKQVERASTQRAASSEVIYTDDFENFYSSAPPPDDSLETILCDAKLQAIEEATKGDEQLEFIVEALKEGKKRAEIADLLDITPRQLDKLREKIIRRIGIHSSSV